MLITGLEYWHCYFYFTEQLNKIATARGLGNCDGSNTSVVYLFLFLALSLSATPLSAQRLLLLQLFQSLLLKVHIGLYDAEDWMWGSCMCSKPFKLFLVPFSPDNLCCFTNSLHEPKHSQTGLPGLFLWDCLWVILPIMNCNYFQFFWHLDRLLAGPPPWAVRRDNACSFGVKGIWTRNIFFNFSFLSEYRGPHTFKGRQSHKKKVTWAFPISMVKERYWINRNKITQLSHKWEWHFYC